MPDEIELTIRGALEAWIDRRPADAAYELREALRAIELELPSPSSMEEGGITPAGNPRYGGSDGD